MAKVSVIVPVFNEENYISKLLNSFLLQTFKDFEVLIYDGGCTDNTIPIVKKYSAKLNIRIFNNPKQKHVFAFNKGIKDATGIYIVILSGHSFIDKDFLKKGLESLKNSEISGVGGVHFHKDMNFFSKISSIILSSALSGGSGSRYSILKKRFASTIVYGMYRRKVLLSNKFDTSFVTGQDLELNLRLCKKGNKLLFNPLIKSFYYSRSSLFKFSNQMFRYGFARGHLIRKGYFGFTWLVPLIFDLYLLGLVFFNGIYLWILYLYLIIVGLDTIRSIFKNGVIGVFNILIMPVHIILGIGLLCGLIK
ncbi:glycosyltransferase [Candidatus Woesearchaeota archaeon]|nr:glycosyltransferase [Candidatus Woesearchaeota archaeon]